MRPRFPGPIFIPRLAAVVTSGFGPVCKLRVIERQFQGQSRLDTWIHKIAVNSALELLRRDRPERWELLEQEPEDELRSPERLHDRAFMAQQFETSLTDLTDLERVCVVLKHVEQWRLQEIADEMNASVGTVKQALFRGVKKLRTTLRQAS